MPSSSNPFEVTIIQKGDSYHVSGRDAAALHAKMASLPVDAQNLIVGPLQNGMFTLQKMQAKQTG